MKLYKNLTFIIIFGVMVFLFVVSAPTKAVTEIKSPYPTWQQVKKLIEDAFVQHTGPDFSQEGEITSTLLPSRDGYIITLKFNPRWGNNKQYSIHYLTTNVLFHTANGDVFNDGTTTEITTEIANLKGPVAIPVDIDLFWRGTTKHLTTTVNIP